MVPMTRRVDVVVVSYNSRRRLRACVEPLAGRPELRVVVVDNASSDRSLEAVADLDVDVVALRRNIGFGAGCNVGWRAGAAPHVLFLNPDTHMSADDVLLLSGVLERSAAGAVAPRLLAASGQLEWSLRRFPEVRSIFGQALFAHRLLPAAAWTDEVIRDLERYEREGPCDWASGACLLVRRASLDAVGGFDEGFFMYCEDVDLCYRLWERGEPVVYTPDVLCVHAGGASAPRWRLLRVLAQSRIRYARKHFGRGRAFAYRLGVGANALTHLLAGRDLRRRLGHARALAAVARPGLET